MTQTVVAFSPLNVQDRTQRNIGHFQRYQFVEKKKIGRVPAFFGQICSDSRGKQNTYGTLRLNSPRMLAAFATMEYLVLKMRIANHLLNIGAYNSPTVVSDGSSILGKASPPGWRMTRVYSVSCAFEVIES